MKGRRNKGSGSAGTQKNARWFDIAKARSQAKAKAARKARRKQRQ